MKTPPVEEMEMEVEVDSEESVDIEELIQYFPGYDDPFWYEKNSRRKRFHEEYTGEWVVPTNPGTQPDIEIRW